LFNWDSNYVTKETAQR